MKVAISSEGNTLDAKMDSRFGRCPWFIVADDRTMEYEALPNPAVSAEGGAGIRAAQFVAHANVLAVISGNYGPKAYETLRAGGIKIYIAHTRTVREALMDFKEKRLPEVESPTVESHYGI